MPRRSTPARSLAGVEPEPRPRYLQVMRRALLVTSLPSRVTNPDCIRTNPESGPRTRNVRDASPWAD